jgi:glycosyltransferase involved in cell wall biosynthesis
MIAHTDTQFHPAPATGFSQRGGAIRTLQLGMNWFPERPGGLDRYYHDLMHHFPDAGVRAHGLVCGSSRVSEDSQGFVQAVAPIGSRLPSRMLAFRHGLIRQRCDFNPHVIGGHFALYTWPVLGRMKNIPLVQHFHGPWFSESRLEGVPRWNCWARYRIERAVYRRADALITLSEVFKNMLLSDFGINESRVKVIPGGVQCNRFDVSQSREQARTLMGWSKDRSIVLAVRRLTRRMGLEHLIQAAEVVKKEQPDVLFLIAGSGPLRSELQRRIDESKLADHVQLLGYVPDEKLPLAYRAADFTVVPSIALEGFGLVAVESLAAGTPALVTPVGGLLEVIRPFCRDLLLRGSSAADLTEGLLQTLANLQRLPRADECKAYARRYDWSGVTAAIGNVLSCVL